MWGEEAFAEAKRSGRPLFILSGAFWCEASDRFDVDALSDPGIARRLNDDYLPVRIDRDLRPDVDDRLQALVQAATSQAGWPLGAFLTPDGRFFHGGTRFAREAVGGRSPFAEVLDRTIAAFRSGPEKAGMFAERIEEEFRAGEGAPRGSPKDRTHPGAGRPDLAPLLAALDAKNGGFNGEPKFPLPLAIEALLSSGEKEARRTAERTLGALARGALHDQIGGGFFRGAKGENWEEPFTGKRVADNAELLRILARTGPSWNWKGAVAGVRRWLDGCPGHAQAADGRFYAWTGTELNRLLSRDERALLAEACALRRSGDDRLSSRPVTIALRADHGLVAKRLRLSPSRVQADIDAVLFKLRAAREERPAPPADPARYAAAEAQRARALIETGAPAAADLVAELVAATAPDGSVPHVLGGPAAPSFAADHAQVGLACLAAHAATREARFLDAARRLAERLDDRFRDRAQDGFLDVDPATTDSFCRRFPLRPVTDLPSPSANGAAALFFVRLARASGPAGAPFLARARETLAAFPKAGALYGPFAGGLVLAALEGAAPPR